MKKTTYAIASSVALAALTLALGAHAATYPKTMRVDVSVRNDALQELRLTHATWLSQASQLDAYAMSSQSPGVTFSLTLRNPRNDSATFRYAANDGKTCEFKFSHEKTFSWFSINPAPEKSATARSIGSVPADCAATVTAGDKSLESYGVRFSMK